MTTTQKPANVSAPSFGEDVPKHHGGHGKAETKGAGIFHVSMPGVKVLVSFPPTMVPGSPEYRDYLEVSADSEEDAIIRFAKYNGIPVKEGGERPVLVSIHQPTALRLTGEEEAAARTIIEEREEFQKAEQERLDKLEEERLGPAVFKAKKEHEAKVAKAKEEKDKKAKTEHEKAEHKK